MKGVVRGEGGGRPGEGCCSLREQCILFDTGQISPSFSLPPHALQLTAAHTRGWMVDGGGW